MSMKENRDILILGIGNEMLMDDGIGPKLVRKLQNFLPVSGIDYTTSLLGGMETIEIIKGYQKVIIVDGVMTGENPPGTVLCMKYPTHRNTLHLSNYHDISFEMSIQLARKLDLPVPDEICIIAVEIVEDRVFGQKLSAPVQKTYSNVFSSVVSIVQEKIAKRSKEDCYEKI
jgi:hydrogenase maturation protease